MTALRRYSETKYSEVYIRSKEARKRRKDRSLVNLNDWSQALAVNEVSRHDKRTDRLEASEARLE